MSITGFIIIPEFFLYCMNIKFSVFELYHRALLKERDVDRYLAAGKCVRAVHKPHKQLCVAALCRTH